MCYNDLDRKFTHGRQTEAEMFDVVLVVDDPDNLLSTLLSDRIFTGSNDMGFKYSESALNSHVMQGFAFVTKKAIQKQMLMNFNNGITKTYKLMSDYIENRDSWDDSFLMWSASVYNMLDTINGNNSHNLKFII